MSGRAAPGALTSAASSEFPWKLSSLESENLTGSVTSREMSTCGNPIGILNHQAVKPSGVSIGVSCQARNLHGELDRFEIRELDRFASEAGA